MVHWLLGAAILCEVAGTVALKLSDGFNRWEYGIVTVIGYGAAFYLLSLCLRTLGIGYTYAVWSGAGIVLVTLAGLLLFGERADWPGVLGIVLIVGGVVLLNGYSRMAGP